MCVYDRKRSKVLVGKSQGKEVRGQLKTFACNSRINKRVLELTISRTRGEIEHPLIGSRP